MEFTKKIMETLTPLSPKLIDNGFELYQDNFNGTENVGIGNKKTTIKASAVTSFEFGLLFVAISKNNLLQFTVEDFLKFYYPDYNYKKMFSDASPEDFANNLSHLLQNELFPYITEEKESEVRTSIRD